MLKPKKGGAFKQEYALAERRGMDMSKLDQIMRMLVYEQPLPPERKDHPLHGSYKGSRECHIQNDWVLIYRVYPEEQKIVFAHTGTHSDLFKK